MLERIQNRLAISFAIFSRATLCASLILGCFQHNFCDHPCHICRATPDVDLTKNPKSLGKDAVKGAKNALPDVSAVPTREEIIKKVIQPLTATLIASPATPTSYCNLDCLISNLQSLTATLIASSATSNLSESTLLKVMAVSVPGPVLFSFSNTAFHCSNLAGLHRLHL